MIPSITLAEEEGQGNTAIERSREIRSRFPYSGLYSTEPSGDCLWKANFYLNDPGFVSVDGKHVVVLGSFVWTGSPFPEDAVMFCIKDGQITNTVYYNDVSPHWWLKRIVLGEWPECTDDTFDEHENAISIKTNLWETIVFDFNTGRVVRFDDPLGKTIGLSIIALIAAGVVILRWYIVRPKRV